LISHQARKYLLVEKCPEIALSDGPHFAGIKVSHEDLMGPLYEEITVSIFFEIDTSRFMTIILCMAIEGLNYHFGGLQLPVIWSIGQAQPQDIADNH
jgi:hypothetical protein